MRYGDDTVSAGAHWMTAMKMVEMPVSDANDLDEVVRELGLEGSHTTPAEAARELFAAIEAKDAEIAGLRAQLDARKMVSDRDVEIVRLREALVLARKEISDHNNDYHHRTRDSTVEAIRAALACRPQGERSET